VSACVPTSAGQCDDHDDCPSGQVCIYGGQVCATSCYSDDDCTLPNQYCDYCATSGCPTCDGCKGACLHGMA
jgi:hypothetical protein